MYLLQYHKTARGNNQHLLVTRSVVPEVANPL